jgi:hypothetical protein
MPIDDVLRDWSARRGWAEGVQLFLLLRYAELHGDAASFAAFLAEVAEAEDQEGVEAEDSCDGPDAPDGPADAGRRTFNPHARR